MASAGTSGPTTSNFNSSSQTWPVPSSMTPNEIMRLRKPAKDAAGRIIAPGGMVVFVAGEAPIQGTQILYFMDPVFAGRAAVPPPASGTTRPAMVFTP